MRKLLLLVLSVAALTAGVAAFGSGEAFAYGSADQPLAQVEISANCNNPAFGLCQEVGLGGIWLWIEIDTGGTADVAGAGCGHVRGLGGGAGSIRGEVPWVAITAADLASLDPSTFVTGEDPNGNYYYLPAFGFVVPQTVGHYSLRPASAVTIQTQVAP
jgi:hypothetical protein